MRFINRISLATIFSLLIVSEANAEGFDIRQFYPISGSEGVFSVESSQTMDHLGYDIKLMTDYANKPLRFTVEDTYDDLYPALEHLVSMTLSGAIGIRDFLEVGISVPFIAYEGFNSDYSKVSSSLIPNKETDWVGDIQVRAKGTILKRKDYHGFGLGAGVILSIPTGKPEALVGDGSFWGRPYIVADYEVGPVEMMINAGFTLRKTSSFLTYESSHRFNYGFGINWHAIENWLDIKGEIFGETPLSGKAFEDVSDNDPYSGYGSEDYLHSNYQAAEFLLGAKVITPIDLNITVGAGAGIGNGTKNPKYHVLFGVEYAPTSKDTDGDGIVDRRDVCPEDFGTEEFDGCPNPDTDGDSWCDPWLVSEKLAKRFECKLTDECPDVAGLDEFNGCQEADPDLDGWCDPWIATQEYADRYSCNMTDECPNFPGADDFKGCANPDTDGDGWCDPWIIDEEMATKFNCKLTDRCPEHAGTDDLSGCPEADEDGDGLCAPFVEELGLYDIFFCSGNDKCPAEAEDFDDFEDDDGCPDVDNDHDGICDPWVSEQGLLDTYAGICKKIDKCPLEPETINGYKDDDGCPDKGKQLVFVLDDKIEIKDKIFFANNKATIQKKSNSLLNQLAATILANPDIKHISVEGHTDDTGVYEKNIVLSRQRAQAVVDALIKRGISAERLSAVGYGPDKPIDPAKTKQARALNRRVEFVITERKK